MPEGLLKTKLFAPPLPLNLVPRTSLLENVDHAMESLKKILL